MFSVKTTCSNIHVAFFFLGLADLTNFAHEWTQTHPSSAGQEHTAGIHSNATPTRRPLYSRWAMLGWPGSGEARGHDKKSTDAAGKDNSTLKGKKLPRSPPGFICATGNGPAIGGAQILLGEAGKRLCDKGGEFHGHKCGGS